MKNAPVLAALAVSMLALPARAEIPAPVRSMIEAALKGGSEAEIVAIVKYARQANPDQAAEIEQLHVAHTSARDTAKREQVSSAGLFDIWSGNGEVGASRSTGTSNTLGVFASLGIAREGLHWRHAVRGEADLQRSGGVTTKERLLAGYEPNYKISDRLFAYGLLQFERDTTLGYAGRTAASGGLGFSAFKQPNLALDVQGGPALRHTVFMDGDSESSIAARAAMTARWALAPTVALTQTASAYVETENRTLTATTGLETKLIGPLTARLSYNVQYESERPDGQEPLDTLSRFTVVYGF